MYTALCMGGRDGTLRIVMVSILWVRELDLSYLTSHMHIFVIAHCWMANGHGFLSPVYTILSTPHSCDVDGNRTEGSA